MSVNIRFPNITGKTEAEQIVQIKSYLHQLVEQLNWALTSIDSGSVSAPTTSTETPWGDISAEAFYELKSLLIKSADTLNAYYDKISKRLESQYVSRVDFEAHLEEFNKSKYVLPVGGVELGGVKNGGNVTINEDGTLTADIPSDEHIIQLISSILDNRENVTG